MSLPTFHDAHCHAPGAASGAFVIALEGTPEFEGTFSNGEISPFHDPARLRIAVPYVRAGAQIEGTIAKYHPRREHYEADWIDADIRRFGRRLVLIDSLNAARWPPRTFFELAQRNAQTEFVMCHAGGYDILEFVKACRFLPNVWLDFSVTQHEFGWVSGERSPGFISELIDHALGERRTAPRIMFGSDFPLLEQADAVERALAALDDPDPLLRGNFERLLDELALS